jgi:hypothetical protein
MTPESRDLIDAQTQRDRLLARTLPALDILIAAGGSERPTWDALRDEIEALVCGDGESLRDA